MYVVRKLVPLRDTLYYTLHPTPSALGTKYVGTQGAEEKRRKDERKRTRSGFRKIHLWSLFVAAEPFVLVIHLLFVLNA